MELPIISYFYNEDSNVIYKRVTASETDDKRYMLFIRDGKHTIIETDHINTFADLLSIETDDEAWKILDENEHMNIFAH